MEATIWPLDKHYPSFEANVRLSFHRSVFLAPNWSLPFVSFVRQGPFVPLKEKKKSCKIKTFLDQARKDLFTVKCCT